jgi:hypothetical protein
MRLTNRDREEAMRAVDKALLELRARFQNATGPVKKAMDDLVRYVGKTIALYSRKERLDPRTTTQGAKRRTARLRWALDATEGLDTDELEQAVVGLFRRRQSSWVVALDLLNARQSFNQSFNPEKPKKKKGKPRGPSDKKRDADVFRAVKLKKDMPLEHAFSEVAEEKSLQPAHVKSIYHRMKKLTEKPKKSR